MLARAFFRHDHTEIQTGALRYAQAYCADHGLIFTPIRKAVLTRLLSSYRPTGAYEVIADLNAAGRAVQAPSVYRALDFLVTHGMAHRIESLNAYVAATEQSRTAPVFLICDGCGRAGQTGSSGLDAVVRNLASDNGFTVGAPVLELRGTCASCADVAVAAE